MDCKSFQMILIVIILIYILSILAVYVSMNKQHRGKIIALTVLLVLTIVFAASFSEKTTSSNYQPIQPEIGTAKDLAELFKH